MTHPPLRLTMLGRITAQARVQDLQCPLVWTTAASFDDVLEEKLRDLVTLAPSTWDAVIRDLTRVARIVHTGCGTLRDIKATLARCYALVRACPGSGPGPCPMLAEYRAALLHVLDSTFATTVCVYKAKNLSDLPGTEHILKYEAMGTADRAAIWAIRAQVKITCYLALDDRKSHDRTPLMDAMLAASRAKDMFPKEGQWKALYGDLLPDDNPRKLTLLRNAVRARRTPFTVTCLSRYLYKLGDTEAFDLMADALVEFPHSVHANVSYVMMYMACPEPGRLSRCLAEQALLRLQRLAPSSVFIAGLAVELRLRSAELRGGAGDCGCTCTQDAGDVNVHVDDVDEEENEAGQAAEAAGGDAAVRGAARPEARPCRRRPFDAVDRSVIDKALRLYCKGDGPLNLVRREATGSVRLDRCNCVCSGYCAYLTYRAHGTLRVGRDQPHACYSE